MTVKTIGYFPHDVTHILHLQDGNSEVGLPGGALGSDHRRRAPAYRLGGVEKAICGLTGNRDKEAPGGRLT